MYHPLITEYFQAEKPFAFEHPETGQSEFYIHGLDFGLDAAEIESHIVIHGGDNTAHESRLRYPISLSKLLDVLQKQA